MGEDFLEEIKTHTVYVSRVLKKMENEGKIFKDEEGKVFAADQTILLNK